MPRTQRKNPRSITFQTTDELYDALKAHAAKNDMSYGAVIRQAVKEYLTNNSTKGHAPRDTKEMLLDIFNVNQSGTL
jgi:hypothetical protein